MFDSDRIRRVSGSVALWWIPLAAFVVLSVWLLGLRGDLWLADHVYALQGGRWSLQSWDLVRYGGIRAYHGLLQGPSGVSGGCFPAGHASAGYAWLSLFFFFSAVKPSWRSYGLVVGAGSGLLLGIDQQVRGAHFMSHDLFTAMICWAVALGPFLLMLRSRTGAGT